MAHFQEFSDIISEDEAPVNHGERRPSKMDMKKPPMKMEISSSDSIDTMDRITPQDLHSRSGGSFNQVIDTKAAHTRKPSAISHAPSKVGHGCVLESSGKQANVE